MFGLGQGTMVNMPDWADTDPDALGGFFSGSSIPGGYHQNADGVLVGADDTSTFFDGFGPGDYSGGYTGDGDRVYWGPDSGTVTIPPAAQLAVNTTPDKFSTHMSGDGVVKGAVKGAASVISGAGSGDSVAGSSTGAR